MQFRPSIATSRFCLRFASFVSSNSASIRDFHRSSSNVATVIVVAFSSLIRFLRLCSLSKQHGSISLHRRNLYMHRRHSTVSAFDSLSSSQNLSPRHHRIRFFYGDVIRWKKPEIFRFVEDWRRRENAKELRRGSFLRSRLGEKLQRNFAASQNFRENSETSLRSFCRNQPSQQLGAHASFPLATCAGISQLSSVVVPHLKLVVKAIFGTYCKLKFLHEHGQNFRRISLAFESTSRLFGRRQVVFVNEKYCRN
ncbi:unnamed protein product [Vicia faba]|uniref:Uncharacterized protein n=1 Tax=Vicia faba TaxID=3906 RepID=A0AAV0YFS5_VICFA|nr:unnamed protein product [Vicia faba]